MQEREVVVPVKISVCCVGAVMVAQSEVIGELTHLLTGGAGVILDSARSAGLKKALEK